MHDKSGLRHILSCSSVLNSINPPYIELDLPVAEDHDRRKSHICYTAEMMDQLISCATYLFFYSKL